jgi:hypothetical protein
MFIPYLVQGVWTRTAFLRLWGCFISYTEIDLENDVVFSSKGSGLVPLSCGFTIRVVVLINNTVQAFIDYVAYNNPAHILDFIVYM